MLHTSSGLNLSANYIIGADFIKPTAIVFMSINIKLYGEIFSLLDIELFNTVLAKNTEHTFPRILTRNLDNKFLRHPRIAGSVRHATVCRKYGDDFTC